MQIRWQQLVIKLTVWGTMEVILNLVGTDYFYLADYSEFLHRSYGDGVRLQQVL